MLWHLSVSNCSPIELNQETMELSSLRKELQSLNVSTRLKILRSSANIRNLVEGIIFFRPLINSEKIIGDKWPPWETPEGISTALDVCSKTLTYWTLPVRYNLSHERIGSPNPDFYRISMRVWWSTLSNVLLKSVNMTSTWELCSKALRM